MKRFFLFILLYSACNFVFSQNKDQITFVKYLLSKELFLDAILESKTILKKNPQSDTSKYLLAKSYFNINTDSSLITFSKLNLTKGELANEKRLFSGFLHTSKKNYSLALSEVNMVNHTSNKRKHLAKIIGYSAKTLQGTLLDSLEEENSEFNYQYRVLNESQDRLRKKVHKSPIISGVLSTVVPGLGKFYVGQKKQGLSAFVITGILGYQTFESYRIGGKKSTRFIISTVLFSTFYIGNIWGSILAVEIVNREFEDEIHNDIIATLRIPMARLFRGELK